MAGVAAHHRFTTAADGDLAVASAGVAGRRRALVDAPWTWLHQVHGAVVVVVEAPGAGAGAKADAAVTAVPGAVVAVQVADCAPVVLRAEGAVGVAHAGWRGLVAGVLPAAVAAVRSLGGERVEAVLGPCIHPCCYEFGSEDLATVVAATGPQAVGRTRAGTAALDVPAAVRAALAPLGVDLDVAGSTCTACTPGPALFSHRARGDAGRQAALAWLA